VVCFLAQGMYGRLYVLAEFPSDVFASLHGIAHPGLIKGVRAADP
jgi:hypothetical protein